MLTANAGATVENMTTEDDGRAAYEAHITKTDGTHATVKLDANYTITATESRRPGPPLIPPHSFGRTPHCCVRPKSS